MTHPQLQLDDPLSDAMGEPTLPIDRWPIIFGVMDATRCVQNTVIWEMHNHSPGLSTESCLFYQRLLNPSPEPRLRRMAGDRNR